MIKEINLPKIQDKRGDLSFFENNNQIPFKIKRICWIYDIPSRIINFNYANIKSHEIIIPLFGSFNLILNDGKKEYKFLLKDSSKAIYVPNLIFKKIESFSSNSIALIASSLKYNSDEYIKDIDIFMNIKNASKKN